MPAAAKERRIPRRSTTIPPLFRSFVCATCSQKSFVCNVIAFFSLCPRAHVARRSCQRSRRGAPNIPRRARFGRRRLVAAEPGGDFALGQRLRPPPMRIASICIRALRGRYTDSLTTSMIEADAEAKPWPRISATWSWPRHVARSRPCAMLVTSILVSPKFLRMSHTGTCRR